MGEAFFNRMREILARVDKNLEEIREANELGWKRLRDKSGERVAETASFVQDTNVAGEFLESQKKALEEPNLLVQEALNKLELTLPPLEVEENKEEAPTDVVVESQRAGVAAMKNSGKSQDEEVVVVSITEDVHSHEVMMGEMVFSVSGREKKNCNDVGMVRETTVVEKDMGIMDVAKNGVGKGVPATDYRDMGDPLRVGENLGHDDALTRGLGMFPPESDERNGTGSRDPIEGTQKLNCIVTAFGGHGASVRHPMAAAFRRCSQKEISWSDGISMLLCVKPIIYSHCSTPQKWRTNGMFVKCGMEDGQTRFSDFAIVWSGAVGLRDAVEVAKQGSVVVITKAEPHKINMNYAQGGVSVVLCPSDSVENHMRDTIVAGAYLGDEETVRVVCIEGRWLIVMRYGKHSHHPIVHVADMTGGEIERVLLEAVKNDPNISVFEHQFAIDLLTSEDAEGTVCPGLDTLNTETQQVVQFISKVTLLAFGGVGHIYPATTNPLVATGDGVVMAHRAKAVVSNRGFVQFHPTSLADEGLQSSYSFNVICPLPKADGDRQVVVGYVAREAHDEGPSGLFAVKSSNKLLNVKNNSNNAENQSFYLWSIGTVIYGREKATRLTHVSSKAVKDVASSFKEDEGEVEQPQKAQKVNGIESFVPKATLRSTNQELFQEELRRHPQAELTSLYYDCYRVEDKIKATVYRQQPPVAISARMMGGTLYALEQRHLSTHLRTSVF